MSFGRPPAADRWVQRHVGRRTAALVECSEVPPSLILDTNVALELVSRGDLWRAFDLSKAGFTEDVRERIFRAQCSFALGLWLHTEKVTTISCARELLQVATSGDYFSPDEDGRPLLKRLGGSEIALFANYLVDCFKGWDFADDNTAPPDAVGNALDDWYVERASFYKVPLLSNEGWVVGGQVDERKGIRKKGRAAGVSVLTTKSFLLGRGVPIREYADRCVTRILRCLANRGIPAPPVRVYEMRSIAQFRCPCSRPRPYGVYCCPHLQFRPNVPPPPLSG